MWHDSDSGMPGCSLRLRHRCGDKLLAVRLGGDGWMGGWGSVRSLLYDIFISYHSYLHLCHHYLHHCLFFFCSQSCRIFLIVEQESISLGQTGARWVDGWMRVSTVTAIWYIHILSVLSTSMSSLSTSLSILFLFPILQVFFYCWARVHQFGSDRC